MPKLGNKRIVSKRGKRIQIADPSAAKDLLELIIDKAKDRRRVVMFCACEEPILKCDDGLPNCHRVEVASLLLKAAKKRGLMLQMSEWPGESPVSLRVKANDSQTRAFATGAHYIPIGSVDARLPAMVTLGWGSNVRFVSPDKTWTVVTGPASVARNKWRLKVFDEADFTILLKGCPRGSAEMPCFERAMGRGRRGFEPVDWFHARARDVYTSDVFGLSTRPASIRDYTGGGGGAYAGVGVRSI
jgi:hypothetical protein